MFLLLNLYLDGIYGQTQTTFQEFIYNFTEYLTRRETKNFG